MGNKIIEDFAISAELIQNEEKYVLIYLEKNYYIQKFLFDLLISIKHENFNKAINLIQIENKLSEKEINSIKDYLFEIINKIISAEESKKYINFSFVVLNEKHVNYFSDKLKWLFEKKIFFPIALISLTLSAYVFIYHIYNHVIISNISFLKTFMIYVVVFIIMIFHELGHASATCHYKIRPKEIGFGFYLIFPVLFANVSKIWELQRNKRIVVNFAGIYFQLIFNILLVFALFIFPSKSDYIIDIIKINIFVALYALIPFIRNDGYWIYSDYFDIQNLNQKSNSIPYQLIKGVFKGESMSKFNPFLIIYSVGNYIFLGILLSNYFSSTPLIVTEFAKIVNTNNLINIFSNHFGVILNFCICIFFTYLIIKTIIRWVNVTFKKTQNEKRIQ